MIPSPIVELLQTGVSVIVGTRDASLMPECTRAWGIRLGKDRRSLTIFLTETISKKTLQNLRENGLVAVSCTRPTDHVACQIKGRVRTIRPSDREDQIDQRNWKREFIAELAAVGVPAALAVEIDVTDVFHQTPGPGTGEKVAP